MQLTELLKKSQKFTIDNSPLILTVVGATGVVTTGILAARGGFQAHQIIDQRESVLRAKREAYQETPHLTAKEKFLLTWQVYLPACAVGTLTVAAVIGANQIGTRRAAALAAAYTISEQAVDRYREKVVEIVGEKKAAAIEDAVQKQLIEDSPVEGREVIIVGNGEQLCYDSWSGRYFMSTMEDVKAAINKVNYEINNNNYASLTDFYNALGLERTQESDEVGWNSNKLLDVHLGGHVASDGRPAIALTYRVEPVRDYFRLY